MEKGHSVNVQQHSTYFYFLLFIFNFLKILKINITLSIKYLQQPIMLVKSEG